MPKKLPPVAYEGHPYRSIPTGMLSPEEIRDGWVIKWLPGGGSYKILRDPHLKKVLIGT